MELGRIAVFVKVVEEGGFTAAARALELPKSSVSRSVALLERELGASLLRRTTRSVALTEAGHAFFEGASRGLASIDDARDAVLDLQATLRGPVTITAAPDTGVWLGPILSAFAREHPCVTVDVTITTRVVDVIEEGFDLALRAGPNRDERLVAQKLPSLDFGVYASPDHLAAHGKPRCVADLSGHRAVVFRSPRGRTTWTLMGPRGEESVDVQGAVSADDFSFMLRCVVAGAGIALLPSFLVERAASGEVERVLPKHAAPGAPLHIVYAGGRYAPRRVVALRELLISELAPAAPKKRR